MWNHAAAVVGPTRIQELYVDGEPAVLFWDGMRVILSPHLTKSGEPQRTRRSWKQRLLERPWRPWEAEDVFIPQVPMMTAIRLNANTLLMHPAMWAEIKRRVAEGQE